MELLVQIRNMVKQKAQSARKPDCDAKRLLLYLLTAMRGSINRLQIIYLLSCKPMNTNQLAFELGIDYKAVQHHLKILQKNNLVSKKNDGYGAVFYLSNYLEANILALDDVVTRLEYLLGRKTTYY